LKEISSSLWALEEVDHLGNDKLQILRLNSSKFVEAKGGVHQDIDYILSMNSGLVTPQCMENGLEVVPEAFWRN
jgi:hypothetical protein